MDHFVYQSIKNEIMYLDELFEINELQAYDFFMIINIDKLVI